MRRSAVLLVLWSAACGGGVAPDLYGEDPHARFLALSQIDGMPEGDVMRRVLELLDDPEPLPRQGAVALLGRIGDPALYPHVRERLADGDPEVRREACAAAARVANEAAIPDLARLARNRDERIMVRQEAVRALASFGRRRDVVEALIQVLPDSPNPYADPTLRTEGAFSEAGVFTEAHRLLQGFAGRTDTNPVRAEWTAWLRQEFPGP